MKRTGTPVDRAVYVGLKSIDSIHQGYDGDVHDHDPLMAHDEHAGEKPSRVASVLYCLV